MCGLLGRRCGAGLSHCHDLSRHLQGTFHLCSFIFLVCFSLRTSPGLVFIQRRRMGTHFYAFGFGLSSLIIATWGNMFWRNLVNMVSSGHSFIYTFYLPTV